MFAPGHRGKAVTIALAAALALAVAAPVTAAPQKDFVRYSIAGDTRLASPLISPPPKVSGQPMRWFHWQPSTRGLQGRAADFGSVAVLGLESMHDLESLRASYGFDRVQAFPALHAAEVSVDAAQLHALLANAPTDPRIRYVSPVGPSRRILGAPNDSLLRTMNPNTSLPYEWQFDASGVDRALELSPGSSAIVVGTIDSGVADIPDLTGKIDGRWFFAGGAPTADVPEGGFDTAGHGTAVASLIAANVNDGFGMAGFGGAAHVIAFRDDSLTDVSISIALTKLVSLGCRIINLSIAGHTPDSPLLVDALHKAAADGVLLVASAGNYAGFVSYPAADLQPGGGERSFGLAIGASNLSGGLASFSSSGKHLSLLAPGDYYGKCSGVLVAIPPVSEFDESCYPTWTGEGGARYAYLAGTSFSAPEVSGVAALVWAARPELKNYQVADIIKQSARRSAKAGWTSTAGCGLLDAAAAVELAIGHAWADTLTGDCSAGGAALPAWPTDVTAPTVLALRATGGWGTMVSLPFKVSDDRNEVAAAIVVQRNAKTVAHLVQDFFGIQSGEVYAKAWQAPKSKTKGIFRFCVTLRDRAGNKSVPGCAPISLG
jgi:subtilisin family serine protease